MKLHWKLIALFSLATMFASNTALASDLYRPVASDTFLFSTDTSSDDLIRLGDSYSAEKNYHQAILLYKKALEQTPNGSANLSKKLAICYAEIWDANNAVVHLENYIKFNYDKDIFAHDSFEKIASNGSYQQLLKTYTPQISAWVLFYLYAGLIGIFIAFIVNLKRDSDKVANLLIGLFVLLHSFFILHISLYMMNYHYQFPHTLYMTASFSFLYGPLLYFYFKRISEGYRLQWRDLWHAVPSLLLLLYLLPIYQLPASEKSYMMLNRIETLGLSTAVIVIIKSASLLTYGFLIYKIYKRSQLQQTYKDSLQWQKHMVLFNSIYIVSYVIYGFFVIINKMSSVAIHPQIVIMAILVLYVGYSAYARPALFTRGFVFDESPLFKYKKSGLTHSYSTELKDRLVQLLTDEKIYKANDISLDMLSEKLGTTRHNTSQVINEHFGMNFFELVNKFRIQEAKEMLLSDVHSNLNIIDIAYEVGYNNKVTFNKAFKKETAVTPSKYVASLHRDELRKLKVNYLRRG